jgi:hypothetical protein
MTVPEGYSIPELLNTPQLSKPVRRKLKHRRKFTPEEDAVIKTGVSTYGSQSWELIAQLLEGRTSRQCRERYFMYLVPDVRNGPWTAEEDLMLLCIVQRIGSEWARIARLFSGRSANNVKNRWHQVVKRQASNWKAPMPNVPNERRVWIPPIRFTGLRTVRFECSKDTGSSAV